MPLYEYQCEQCDHRFEVIQKSFSEAPVEKCPKCGGAVRKLVSSPAIQFKGSGFYITDYARKESASAESKSEGSTSADGGTTTEKTDKTDKADKAGKTETTAAAGASDSSAKPTASSKAPADPVK